MAYVRHFDEILDVAIDDDTVNLRPGRVIERGSIPDDNFEDFEDNGSTAVNSNVMTENRAPASRVPQWILNKLREQNVSRPPVMRRYLVSTNTTQQEQQQYNKHNGLAMLRFSCLLCFLPCIFDKLCMTILVIFSLIAAIQLITLTSTFSLHCSTISFIGAVPLYVLSGIILIMVGVCIFVACSKENEFKGVRMCCFMFASLLGIVFLVMVVVLTVFTIYGFVDNYTCSDFMNFLLIVVLLSYGLVVFFCAAWIVCYFISKELTY